MGRLPPQLSSALPSPPPQRRVLVQKPYFPTEVDALTVGSLYSKDNSPLIPPISFKMQVGVPLLAT